MLKNVCVPVCTSVFYTALKMCSGLQTQQRVSAVKIERSSRDGKINAYKNRQFLKKRKMRKQALVVRLSES